MVEFDFNYDDGKKVKFLVNKVEGFFIECDCFKYLVGVIIKCF